MSTDDEEPLSPFLPKDSDRGSSVSSELQDEYEELLRYAVVTPKFETLHSAAHLHRLNLSRQTADNQESSQRKDNKRSQRPADTSTEAKDEADFFGGERSFQASSLIVEATTLSRASKAEDMAAHSFGRGSIISDINSHKLERLTERPKPSSPEFNTSEMMELFISEENIGQMENILDTWSSNLKSNVLNELRKWKLAFIEQHKSEIRKENERCAAKAAALKAELEGLKGLLHTYEISNQRKDEVISKLTKMMDRQKTKLEQMKSFTHWRVQHCEAKEEAHAARVADQHYNLQLKKKVWSGWQSLIQKHWKVKVERACRARAEEVCAQLSTQYEAKLEERCDALEQAQTEIQRLRLDRERYEESMKKAFMRGVCALNMEALNMFHDGRPEQPPLHDQHDPLQPQDEPGSAAMAPPPPFSFARFSPFHFDHADHGEAEGMMGPSDLMPRAEVHPSAPFAHNSSSSHKQFNGRIVTSSHQKPTKTVTARVTGLPDVNKAAAGKFQMMTVAPPMSSVIIERHHPVTQLTISQATAAKFPRSFQQSHSSTRGRGSSKTQTHTCQVHSIKVVD
ncbi:centrosomal protein POC5 [Cynoglossus semilaevis]|uniref:centrosomal protein POC5 n=1 Tax=Cynoglossus semilaevis TaxID=244447 RepID=UPI000496D1A3|nr:centrosomal protein POC5 [Cynoglossus semilaevis]XP_024909016.1 centrosomal protein POC5 [Cynoglossus semilaevis]